MKVRAVKDSQELELSVVMEPNIQCTRMKVRVPLQKSQSGGVAYIHGSSQGQFVLETYFVMMIYGLIVAGMIMLTEAGESKADVGKRKIFAVVGLGLLAFFFSLILSIFRSKAGGYPYSFLIK